MLVTVHYSTEWIDQNLYILGRLNFGNEPRFVLENKAARSIRVSWLFVYRHGSNQYSVTQEEGPFLSRSRHQIHDSVLYKLFVDISFQVKEIPFYSWSVKSFLVGVFWGQYTVVSILNFVNSLFYNYQVVWMSFVLFLKCVELYGLSFLMLNQPFNPKINLSLSVFHICVCVHICSKF